MAEACNAAVAVWVIVFTLAPTTLAAQTPEELSDLVASTLEDESGTSPGDLGDQQLTLLRVPVSISLRSLERHPWGLKLRLAGTFSVHDFEDLGSVLEDPKVNAVALVPGIEFLIPLSRTITLRPFLDVGGARDTGGRVTAFMGTMGTRAELLFLKDPYRIGLEPLLQYNLSSTPKRTHGFFNASVRAMVRRAVWFTIEEHQPDAGIYAEAGYFYDELEFTTGSGSGLDTRDGFELGVTAGFFYPRPKVWFVRVPRLSVGYRFGKLEGIRIRLGGDFATPVWD